MKNEQAQRMWNLMAWVLSLENGLLKGYASDVYECDRKAVGAIWAPDSKYLWLVRENGSHLSRIGVGEKKTEVEVVLCSLEGELQAQRHCIWLIETSDTGEPSMKKVSRSAALTWCRYRQYAASGGEVTKGGTKVATVRVVPKPTGPGIWGCEMDIVTRHEKPARVDILASYCHGLELATKMLGLFVKVGAVRVNGEPIDSMAPVYEIEESRQGDLMQA